MTLIGRLFCVLKMGRPARPGYSSNQCYLIKSGLQSKKRAGQKG